MARERSSLLQLLRRLFGAQLAQPQRSVSASAGPQATAAPPQPMLGRYRIERQLGRGAMGAVYLGHDVEFGRPAAIKTLALSREFEGDALRDARARFFREAEAAARLRHPDIVSVFDAGEDRGLAYIAMEFVPGQDLGAHTNPARLLPVPAVLGIVARAADALAYAHSRGIAHRDVKPANIMVEQTSGTVKVMDFGIANLGGMSGTKTGIVLGTPSFMSPEQMAGDRVDGRSDLYSLGVTLFQLLTGRLPFRGDSMASLMRCVANEPAPDIRSLRPELPQALAQIVATALAKRPEARQADGRQLAAALRAVALGADPPRT